MERTRIAAVDVRRPDLRRPFPRRFAARLSDQTVTALDRRAKYLVASLSSGETLLMHLGMSGSFRLERGWGAAGREKGREKPHSRSRPATAPLDTHDHVVFYMSSGVAVVFNDPRRFGIMELVPAGQLHRHPVLSKLGPEPLSREFDGAALARACRGKKTPLKAALLDQRVVAGLGNIYASEALHVAGLSPRRRASILATSSGLPRESAHRLAAAIKQVLEAALARQSKRTYRDARFLVYDREGERCSKSGCTGTIRQCVQSGRSTYFCPVCQHA